MCTKSSYMMSCSLFINISKFYGLVHDGWSDITSVGAIIDFDFALLTHSLCLSQPSLHLLHIPVAQFPSFIIMSTTCHICSQASHQNRGELQWDSSVPRNTVVCCFRHWHLSSCQEGKFKYLAMMQWYSPCIDNKQRQILWTSKL